MKSQEPKSTQVQLRITPRLKSAAEAQAKSEGRTLSEAITNLIVKWTGQLPKINR